MCNFAEVQYVLFPRDRVHALFQNILFCTTCHHFRFILTLAVIYQVHILVKLAVYVTLVKLILSLKVKQWLLVQDLVYALIVCIKLRMREIWRSMFLPLSKISRK